MVYQIYYGEGRPRNVMFDIEMYLSINENHKNDNDKWYVEMHSDSFISGAVMFIRHMFTERDKFNFEEFKNDCYELEELRGWLWETHSNRPRTLEEAQKDRNEWQEYIKNKIYDFANKYGLFVNTD